MSHPCWVAVKDDPHGGVVHQADDGFWWANNWQGCLGGFASEGEAVLAIHEAPPKPKQRRKPKADPPEAMKDWRVLIDPASGYIVRDGRGLAIGGVKPEGTGFAAWSRGKLLGEYPTRAGADAAVVRAAQAKKTRR